MLQRQRLLLVDDNPDFLHSIQRFLSHLTGVSVVGTARSGEEALEQIPQLRPDVVLMDLSMPGLGGIAATQQMRQAYPDVAVVILTLHDLEEYRDSAREAGADVFMVKTEVFKHLPAYLAALATRPSAGDAHDGGRTVR